MKTKKEKSGKKKWLRALIAIACLAMLLGGFTVYNMQRFKKGSRTAVYEYTDAVRLIEDTNAQGVGTVEVSTLKIPSDIPVRRCCYTATGTVLLSCSTSAGGSIYIMNDDGSELREIYSGLMDRPYGDVLHSVMDKVYMYSVTGVRDFREGNIGPAIINVERSMTERGYMGIDVSSEDPDLLFAHVLEPRQHQGDLGGGEPRHGRRTGAAGRPEGRGARRPEKNSAHPRHRGLRRQGNSPPGGHLCDPGRALRLRDGQKGQDLLRHDLRGGDHL